MTETTEPTQVNRRSFLKQSGVVGGLGLLPNVEVDQPSQSKADLRSGTQQVIDAKIVHPNVNDVPVGIYSMPIPNTFVNETGLFLITVPAKKLAGRTKPILRTPNNVTFLETTNKYVQKNLHKETPVDGRFGSFLEPKIRYDLFTLTFQTEGNDVIVQRGTETVGTIPENTKKTLQLPSRNVEVTDYGGPKEKEIARPGVSGTTTVRPEIGTRTVAVTPKLVVENHGTLAVYSSEKGPVVPNTGEFPIAGMIGGTMASRKRKIEPNEEGDMFILHHKYSYRGTYNQEGSCP